MSGSPQQEICNCLVCGRSHRWLGNPPWKLFTADQFREQLRERFPNWSHEAMGEALEISAGFVGLVLSGDREPSRKITDAMGFERIVYYRRKAKIEGTST